MKATDLRKVCEHIGRFADLRTSATYPRDRIVVQAKSGVLKLIAGAEWGTLIAVVGPTQENFVSVVSAREFLQAVKAAKGDVNISAATDWADVRITNDKGGEIKFGRLDTKAPDFIRPLPLTGHADAIVMFDKGQLAAVAKMADSVYGSKEGVHCGVQVFVEGMTRAVLNVTSIGGTHSAETHVKGIFPDKFVVNVSSEFIVALRGITDAVGLSLMRGEAVVQGAVGPYIFVGKLRGDRERQWPIAVVPPFSTLGLAPVDQTVTVDRKVLVQALRQCEGIDEYGRVNISGGTVGRWSDQPFNVRAPILKNLLMGVSSKKVELGFRSPERQPISISADDEVAWNGLIFPVAKSS